MTAELIEEYLPFIIFGLVFAGIGIAILCASLASYRRSRKNCTEQVVAKCVRISNSRELAEKEGEEPDEADSGIKAPIFEISYNGSTIELQPHVYSNICKTEVGEIRNIYINPNKPEQYYDPKEERVGMGWIEVASAIGMIIFGLLFIFIPILSDMQQ